MLVYMSECGAIPSEFGSLILTTWIGKTPEGRWSPYLLASTDHPNANDNLGLWCKVLGLPHVPGTVNLVPESIDKVRVIVGSYRLATLVAGPTTYEFPADEEWREMAAIQERVVLALAFEPQPALVGADGWAVELSLRGMVSVALIRAEQEK